jgi:hypothetical protein
VEGYTVAGKTGTAQKFDASLGRYSPHRSVASFVGYLPATQPRATIVVSIDEPQAALAWGGVAAAPVFSVIAEQTMRYLRVAPDGSPARPVGPPVAVLGQPSPGAKVVTLSVGNFVENVREMMREMTEQMASYMWGHFLALDTKDLRKPRKKAERSDR